MVFSPKGMISLGEQYTYLGRYMTAASYLKEGEAPWRGACYVVAAQLLFWYLIITFGANTVYLNVFYRLSFAEIFRINPLDVSRMDENAGDGNVGRGVDDLLWFVG